MRLLILTQKVDKSDPILGFFHRWIEEFAGQCEQVTVVALSVGEYRLPKNVRVYSLGKEFRQSRLMYLSRFFRYIFRERSHYDAVFVHMNPEYVLLGGLFWRWWRKRIGLSYTHRQVNMKLRIAEKLAHVVFSAAPESFRVASAKLRIVAHGIDVSEFSCPARTSSGMLHIVSVGRLTPIKNCDTLIRAAALLKRTSKRKWSVVFLGDPATPRDTAYAEKLRTLVEVEGVTDMVHFLPSVSNEKVREFYCNADIVVNMTPTGGLDKAVIEGMASGAITVSSNAAFRPYWGNFADMLWFPERDQGQLAAKLEALAKARNKKVISEFLRRTAEEKFSVESLIPRYLAELFPSRRVGIKS